MDFPPRISISRASKMTFPPRILILRALKMDFPPGNSISERFRAISSKGNGQQAAKMIFLEGKRYKNRF